MAYGDFASDMACLFQIKRTLEWYRMVLGEFEHDAFDTNAVVSCKIHGIDCSDTKRIYSTIQAIFICLITSLVLTACLNLYFIAIVNKYDFIFKASKQRQWVQQLFMVPIAETKRRYYKWFTIIFGENPATAQLRATFWFILVIIGILLFIMFCFHMVATIIFHLIKGFLLMLRWPLCELCIFVTALTNSELCYHFYAPDQERYKTITMLTVLTEDIPQFTLQLAYAIICVTKLHQPLSVTQVLSFCFTFWCVGYNVSFKNFYGIAPKPIIVEMYEAQQLPEQLFFFEDPALYDPHNTASPYGYSSSRVAALGADNSTIEMPAVNAYKSETNQVLPTHHQPTQDPVEYQLVQSPTRMRPSNYYQIK
jgi:hypothetical protein